jgi:integrase/recombinase XerD
MKAGAMTAGIPLRRGADEDAAGRAAPAQRGPSDSPGAREDGVHPVQYSDTDGTSEDHQWRDTRRGARCASDWRAALERLEGAYAATTLRGYRADFAVFEAWCARAGETPLPASPEAVADFVADCAAGRSSPTARVGDAPATLKRRMSAIRKVHRLMRMTSPVEDEEVKTALRRAIRSKGSRQRQAHGLNIDLREELIDVCCETTLAGMRDRAMVAVGYDTLCRRSELVALRVCDLTRNADGGMTLVVRRSKADPLGEGRIAYLTPRSAQLLETWLEAAGIVEGALFRGLRRKQLGEEALDPSSVSRILKRLARRAAFDEALVAELSSHSMRIGAAQDMSTADFGLLALMAAGGWKTIAVVSRYVEKALVAHVGRTREARLAKRFGSLGNGDSGGLS